MFIPIGDNVKKKKFPFFTLLIILLNILVFIGIRINEDLLFFPYQVKNIDFTTLIKIFISMFVHGSIFHIFFNMIFLFAFGKSVEEKIGHIRFLLLYTAGGFFSLFFYVLFNIESKIPIIGASGAISTIIGAYFIYFFKKRVNTLSIIPPFKLQISSWIFILIWLISQFLNVKSTNIAVLAHLGGFLYGLIASKAFDT